MMLRKFLAGVLALCFAVSAHAADQVPLKRNNGIPAAFGTGDTVGVSHGGTGAASASGTAIDNISGFASTGFLTRTGAGAYSFQSLTNGISLGNIAQIAANTVVGNATASTANAAAQSMPSCSTSISALKWTTSTGFGCTTLGSFADQNYATPPAIGATTPASGKFTTLTATSTLTTNITGSTQCVQANSSGVLSGTGSACGGGGGGGAVACTTQTVSGASTVDFTGWTAGYHHIIYGGQISNSTASNFYLQAGTGAGPTWDTTAAHYNWFNQAPLDAINTTNSSDTHIVPYAGNATNSDVTIEVHVMAPDLSFKHWIEGTFSRGGARWGGTHLVTAVVTGVRLVWSAGTISGTFSDCAYTR